MRKKRNSATTPQPKRPVDLHAGEPRLLKPRLVDTSSESSRKKCERESLMIANDLHEAEVLDWIARVADVTGDWS
jgi:hypothetical protein